MVPSQHRGNIHRRRRSHRQWPLLSVVQCHSASGAPIESQRSTSWIQAYSCPCQSTSFHGEIPRSWPLSRRWRRHGKDQRTNVYVSAFFPGISKHLSFSRRSIPSLGDSFPLQWSNGHSASLLLNNTASRESVDRLRDLEEYIVDNHRSWHTFITGELRRSCEPDEVVCISGCVKTSEWAMTATIASSRTPQDQLDEGQLSESAASGLQVVHNTEPQTFYHAGPESPEASPLSQINSDQQQVRPFPRVKPKNQCIFVSYYKVKYRKRRQPRLVAADGGENNICPPRTVRVTT